MTAKLHSPGHIVAIDLDSSRLEKAAEFGADVVIDSGREDALEKVMELTGGLGADVAIERSACRRRSSLHRADPAGRPRRQRRRARPSSHAPSREAVDPRRPIDGSRRHDHDAEAPRLIESGRLDPTPFATHRFALADAEEAYNVFGDAAESHALKVVLEAEGHAGAGRAARGAGQRVARPQGGAAPTPVRRPSQKEEPT
jgi:alcohol dehydrogenase